MNKESAKCITKNFFRFCSNGFTLFFSMESFVWNELPGYKFFQEEKMNYKLTAALDT